MGVLYRNKAESLLYLITKHQTEWAHQQLRYNMQTAPTYKVILTWSANAEDAVTKLVKQKQGQLMLHYNVIYCISICSFPNSLFLFQLYLPLKLNFIMVHVCKGTYLYLYEELRCNRSFVLEEKPFFSCSILLYFQDLKYTQM